MQAALYREIDGTMYKTFAEMIDERLEFYRACS